MLFIVIAIILFSFNNVLWKKNLVETSVVFLVTYRSFITSCIALLVLFLLSESVSVNSYIFFKITVGSLFGVVGLYSMLYVIKTNSLQWIGVYNLIGICFTAFYLWFFESIDVFVALAGLLIIIVGFVFYIYSNINSQITISKNQHLVLFVMTFSFSLSALIHWKNLEQDIPSVFIIANQEIIVFFSGLIFMLKQTELSKLKTNIPIYFKKVSLMSLVIFLALLFSFIGLKDTNPLTSSILFLASPLTTILFSSYFFKEKISVSNWLCIFIIAFGAFVVHYQTT